MQTPFPGDAFAFPFHPLGQFVSMEPVGARVIQRAEGQKVIVSRIHCRDGRLGALQLCLLSSTMELRPSYIWFARVRAPERSASETDRNTMRWKAVCAFRSATRTSRAMVSERSCACFSVALLTKARLLRLGINAESSKQREGKAHPSAAYQFGRRFHPERQGLYLRWPMRRL